MEFLTEANSLLIKMEALKTDNPDEFISENMMVPYNAMRVFMNLMNYRDEYGTYTGINKVMSDFIAALITGKGEVDLRLLLGALYETYGNSSIAAICEKADITPSTMSNYRNGKIEVTTFTWEKFVNVMIE